MAYELIIAVENKVRLLKSRRKLIGRILLNHREIKNKVYPIAGQN
jgi:hypothetical protein